MDPARDVIERQLRDLVAILGTMTAVDRALRVDRIGTVARWFESGSMPYPGMRIRIDALWRELLPKGLLDSESKKRGQRRYRRFKLGPDGFIDGDGI